MSTDIVPTEAKPFASKEEYEQWVTDCATTEQRIKSGLRKGREAMWDVAEGLHAFDAQSGWLALGYETQGEWLADPDITLSRATYYRLVQGWQEMVVVRELDVSTLRRLDVSKVQIALPALKEGRAVLDDVVADVESLGARDLRVKYRDEPEHDYEPAPEGAPSVDGESRNDLDQTQADEAVDVQAFEQDLGGEPVQRGVAQALVTVLAQVLREVGAPERKAMSSKLREHCRATLEYAYVEAGLSADV